MGRLGIDALDGARELLVVGRAMAGNVWFAAVAMLVVVVVGPKRRRVLASWKILDV